MLKIEKLSKRYGGKRALTEVTVELPRGEIVGLFGENGAGKTTMMKAVLGLIPFSGAITLDGEAVGRRNIEKFSFGTCEHSFIPNLTAMGHRDFYAEMFPAFSEKRFNGLMDFFELPRHRPIHTFSAGQKNQFEVIMALSQGADYILLDEPFAGNDVFNREDFYRVLLGILEPHETVILSTHLIEEVSDFVGRALLLRHGRLVGDARVMDLEDRGMSLMDYIKETYHYRADRVSRALRELGGEEDEA